MFSLENLLQEFRKLEDGPVKCFPWCNHSLHDPLMSEFVKSGLFVTILIDQCIFYLLIERARRGPIFKKFSEIENNMNKYNEFRNEFSFIPKMRAYPDYWPVNPFTILDNISETYMRSNEFISFINQILGVFENWFAQPENENIKWNWVRHAIAEDIVQRSSPKEYVHFGHLLKIDDLIDDYKKM